MFLVVITGFVLGSRAGFLVGAMTPLISNFFIGHGPWTPWQMLAWKILFRFQRKACIFWLPAGKE